MALPSTDPSGDDRSDTPWVSVVVPCLNRKQWIRPTLESIFAQTYPHVECIVMDGGSTDGTLDILATYREQITLAVGEDSGQADAINKGWQKSRGEILTWLNADDLLRPEAVEKAVHAFATHPDAAVVYGDAESIDEEGRVIAPMPARPITLEELLVCYEHPITQPASFSRRSALERAGWIHVPAFGSLFDYELWFRMALVGTLRYIPDTLAQARSVSEYSPSRRAVDTVAMMRHVFRELDLPEPCRRLRRPAMSAAYIRASWYNWNAEQPSVTRVLVCLLRALLADPWNAPRIWQEYLSYQRDRRMRKAQAQTGALPIPATTGTPPNPPGAS